MTRLAILVALAACGSSAPAPAVPVKTAVRTCEDVGTAAAKLVGDTTDSDMKKQCVDDHWSQALIDCFSVAADWAAAHQCLPAKPAPVEPG